MNEKKKTQATPAALAALLVGDMGNAAAAMTPGGIEAQEKQGQIDESFRETLPKQLGDFREGFEKLGFEFGEAADDLFQEVRFPDGWKKQCTDHSMWTDLVDGEGRKRGGIFYKAAFYDRSAHAYLSPRFNIAQTYPEEQGAPTKIYVEDAAGEVKKTSAELAQPNWSVDRKEAERRLRLIDEAKEAMSLWLDENWPEWRDVTAYWD